MNKNALIVFLLLLLLIAGIFIARDLLQGDVKEVPDAEDVEVEQISGAEMSAETEASVSQEETVTIVGQWQRSDDPQSSLTFQADGVLIDVYGGGAINEAGTYDYVDSANDLPAGVEYDPQATYLRQTFGNESYYYEVVALDSDSLELLSFSGTTSTLRYIRAD